MFHAASAQKYVDASTLTIIGLTCPMEGHPYYRVDTTRYRFDNATIRHYCGYPAGVAVLFTTDSRRIEARWTTAPRSYGWNMPPVLQRGMDLYVRENGVWTMAGAARPGLQDRHASTIVEHMDGQPKECMLYLPAWSELLTLEIGVDALPAIRQDNTDRNRTSPMAFTGNKFEFRMLGSSQSISGPNITLNTIMAEELEQFADELEVSRDFQADLEKLIRRVFTEHQRIIFNGNGYDEAWLEEAGKRGLSNLTSTADALPMYTAPKNVDLFVKHGIYTKEEIEARAEIHIENYTTVLTIEAKTMADMIRHQILPAVSDYADQLCQRAYHKDAMGVPHQYETSTAMQIGTLTDALQADCAKLEADLAAIPVGSIKAMNYCHEVLIPDMAEARKAADQLETLTASKSWPFPVYSDLLFYV